MAVVLGRVHVEVVGVVAGVAELLGVRLQRDVPGLVVVGFACQTPSVVVA